MTLQEFKSSLSQNKPPQQLSVLLQALWYDGKENWEAAHDLAQDVNTPYGSWIHAYLHRKEGDNGNASYWYQKANRKMPLYSLGQEWEEITEHFLTNSL
jgi:hypothetical protein